MKQRDAHTFTMYDCYVSWIRGQPLIHRDDNAEQEIQRWIMMIGKAKLDNLKERRKGRKREEGERREIQIVDQN